MSDHYYIKQALNKPDAEAISLLAMLLPELRTIFLADGLIEPSDYDDLADRLAKEEKENEWLMYEKEKLEDERADLIDEIERLKDELAERQP